MNRFRSLLFWVHLAVGLTAGIIILLMSVTGVLLTYQRQITAWADARQYPITAPAGATRLPAEALLAAAQKVETKAEPTTLTVRNEPSAAVQVAFGRTRTLFVDPYTARVLGEGSTGVRRFFTVMTDWHRWLGRAGDSRDMGKAITGAANLGFLFLVASGLYLWFPRRWTRPTLRNVLWFRRGLGSKARDFNWHNVIGFWMFVPLFLVVLSGVVISYPWASAAVYKAFGETPPARPAPAGGGGAAAGGAGRGGGGGREEHALVDAGGLGSLMTRAERQVQGWRTIRLAVPEKADAPVVFTIDRGTGGQPHKQAQLTLDRATGQVVKWKPYSANTPGQRMRSFLRFAHTGEVGGLLGQTLAGIASLGGAVLVWTGLALAWRRFRSWRARKRRPAAPAVRRPAADRPVGVEAAD
ncbi:MAG TPA: PepSY-associated TM helix domain-containing protein [Longimicrobium sp.]|nr:PepSY-associated TM helix domain-containing protein [Longimicrobium sp.]